MKNRQILFFGGILCLLFSGIIINSINFQISSTSTSTLPTNIDEGIGKPEASQTNLDIINDILDSKLNQYSTNGRFNQEYESSLQATYYALSILNSIGKLSEIDQSKIIQFILSYYDNETDMFMDSMAYRYLDMDPELKIYPYSSVLEINCYALLSLHLLGALNQINLTGSIDYILDCYQPDTSGFIGQKYSSTIDPTFKNATLDNTYYAVITIDTIDSWDNHPGYEDAIKDFIKDLQSSIPVPIFFGGFCHDGPAVKLTRFFEPNLLSSYYAIKSLEVFDKIDTIRISDFHQYLDEVYSPSRDLFNISAFESSPGYCNLIATAIGLELSDLTGYSGINRNEVLQAILDNRNNLGVWNNSVYYNQYELMDTFQIIRVLNNTGDISQLTTQDKEDIKDYIEMCEGLYGYSLLSNDYISLNLLWSTIYSFDLYNREDDLDREGLLHLIESMNYFDSLSQGYGFLACNNIDQEYPDIRSSSMDYYTQSKHKHVDSVKLLMNHESIYYALDSLERLDKLDGFEISYGHNLTLILESILSCQFLESGYDENYGAFLPFTFNTLEPKIIQNKSIFFEYSYYAIKAMEVLADYLDLGNISDLNFDVNALDTYIFNHYAGQGDTRYFKGHTNTYEYVLKDTYYMIYILKAIDMYDLDDQMIQNYVEANIDYTSLESIYYSFKISEILELDIDFDFELTQALVQELYNSTLNEFSIKGDDLSISHETFAWICDMAKNDKVRINPSYNTNIPIGTNNNISATLQNIILERFGSYMVVKFESSQLGLTTLDIQPDNSYQKEIQIDIDSNNYPIIYGSIYAEDTGEKVSEVDISFSTSYTREIDHTIIQNSDSIEVIVSLSLVAPGGNQPIANAHAYLKVYIDGELEEYLSLTPYIELDKSMFGLVYEFDEKGEYEFEIYLDDTYASDLYKVAEYSVDYKIESGASEEPAATTLDPTVIANSFSIAIILACAGGFGIVGSRYLPKKRRHEVLNT